MSGRVTIESTRDLAGWASALGVSREAVEVCLDSDIIDLHVDSFIWTRVIGYDIRKPHGRGLLGARCYSQADLPRLRAAHVTGAVWVITTNPVSSVAERGEVFAKNLQYLTQVFATASEQAEIVRDVAEYRAAHAAGRHAAFLGIQGGNALEWSSSLLDEFAPGLVVLVTLVHLTSSGIGATSSPLRMGNDYGLTVRGRELVHWLDEHRIFVDLAHLSPRGFADALAEHDRSRPLLVSHTGVSAVHPHWRNLDDSQMRAIAETGGTIGVFFDSGFLGGCWLGGRASRIVEHVDHIVQTIGEDFVSLGSDWDGAIVTPRDLPTCLELPRLVALMLERGYRPERIQKILGNNFLRALAVLRGQEGEASISESKSSSSSSASSSSPSSSSGPSP